MTVLIDKVCAASIRETKAYKRKAGLRFEARRCPYYPSVVLGSEAQDIAGVLYLSGGR